MFELQSKFPLAFLNGARFRGLAYDGCSIYLTVHGASTILQLDKCFHKTACFSTCRAYTAICYDHDEACFWAATDDCSPTIYKLNKCLEEIDSIKVRSSKGCCTPIAGISYNCCDHSLAVTFTQEIIRVCPGFPEKQTWILKARQGRFLYALSLCPHMVCYYLEGTKCSLCTYTSNGELLHKTTFPLETQLEAATFWPCIKEDGRCHFLVLLTEQGCKPCLCDYTLVCDALCNAMCSCNYEPCQPCPHPEPSGDACTDVLESIALVEAALAHILNAEGEKIQKVVALSDDVSEILAVNESVNKTLNNVIFLEQILCCKLERLNDCCDLCAECKPCKSCEQEHCEHDRYGGQCEKDCV